MTLAEKGVSRFLVRYGAPGFVGCFGTVHSLHAPRGTHVVVATDRGEELGEVLVGSDADLWKHDSRPPTGEVLRIATPDDQRRATELARSHLPVLEQCQRLAAERGVEAVVVDGETLLDGRHIILYFLGEATEKLGPLAVELGRMNPAGWVQFQSWESPEVKEASVTATSSFEATVPSRLTRQELWKSNASGRWPDIAAALHDATRDRLPREDAFLLQLHGVYQQQDRDQRAKRSVSLSPADASSEKRPRHFFMVRTRAPGGRLTARQMLVHLDLAERYGLGTVRVTSRQGLQIHGVAKGGLREVIREINDALLTTLGACGDVSRNVMCCPAPLRQDRIRTRLQSLAVEISRYLTPHATPYYDIWLDEGPSIEMSPSVNEPVYGPIYLPRKIKLGLTLPEDNCIDVLTQDVGLVAAVEGERLLGFDVFVGGGLGTSPQRGDTFARLAEPIGFVSASDALRVIDAIVKVHRDNSSRQDRRRARLKYLLAEWGVERFRTAVEAHLDRPLAPALGVAIKSYDDHLGWHLQGDGHLFLGVPLISGRIEDTDTARAKTALREILEQIQPSVRLTPQQNLLLCDLTPEQRPKIEAILHAHGVAMVEELSPLRRRALACPAFPTCGLAVAEAERLLPRFLSQVEQQMNALGLTGENISLRIAGCANACSRTATAEIALVGCGQGMYAMYLGGDSRGDRLNVLYRSQVAEPQIANEVYLLLTRYQSERIAGETLADFLRRLGERAESEMTQIH